MSKTTKEDIRFCDTELVSKLKSMQCETEETLYDVRAWIIEQEEKTGCKLAFITASLFTGLLGYPIYMICRGVPLGIPMGIFLAILFISAFFLASYAFFFDREHSFTSRFLMKRSKKYKEMRNLKDDLKGAIFKIRPIINTCQMHDFLQDAVDDGAILNLSQEIVDFENVDIVVEATYPDEVNHRNGVKTLKPASKKTFSMDTETASKILNGDYVDFSWLNKESVPLLEDKGNLLKWESVRSQIFEIQ